MVAEHTYSQGTTNSQAQEAQGRSASNSCTEGNQRRWQMVAEVVDFSYCIIQGLTRLSAFRADSRWVRNQWKDEPPSEQ